MDKNATIRITGCDAFRKNRDLKERIGSMKIMYLDEWGGKLCDKLHLKNQPNERSQENT